MNYMIDELYLIIIKNVCVCTPKYMYISISEVLEITLPKMQCVLPHCTFLSYILNTTHFFQ